MLKRIIYPPMWLAFGLIAIFALNEFLPGPRFGQGWGRLVGGGLILIGLVLLVIAGGLFKRAGTDMIPFRDVSALVTTGVYRFTRNPMYLGMLSVLLGCAITVGSSFALLIPPAFAIIIEWRFIRPEEGMLRDLFGEEYVAYCKRVRRWL